MMHLIKTNCFLPQKEYPSKLKPRNQPKTQLYNPCRLYGLDCSTWKQTSLQMLEVFQTHIMRFMTSPTMLEKVKITTLRQHTNLRPLVSFLQEKKLKLFGHFKRSSKGLAKVCLEGKVLGKRTRGRRRQRWSDDTKSWINCSKIYDFNNMVKDRDMWRSICNGATHSAT